MKQILFLGIILLMLTGCHTHNHEHSQESHSHDTPLLLCVYDNSYEVFLEAQPFAQGRASSVTIYLTELPNKPAEVQSITLSMIIGDKGIRQTQDKYVSPGVYQFVLNPETTGKATIVVDIQSEIGKHQLKMENVTVYDDVHKADHTVEEETQHYPDAINFNKAQQWKINFATALPEIETFGQVIKTTGQIASSQIDETIIVSKSSGIVLFDKNILEGQTVSASQTLFVVSGSGMAENNINVQLVEAQNNFIKAESDYKRAANLLEDKIVSEKEFLEIKSSYETSKAVYENLRKNFSNKGQRISSPLSGYIKQLLVSNGEYVEAGQALATISKNKSLLLKADVQMKYASFLPNIVSANFKIMNGNKTYSLNELNGRVLSYGKTAAEDNYMLPVTFLIDNKADFVSGNFVEVYIQTKSDKQAMTIPNSALTEEQGAYFVYVQLTPEFFEKRQITIGSNNGIKTEILSGLNPEERVVSQGAISVKLAQSAGALDPHAGHVH